MEKFYTGIGSRETPKHIQYLMAKIAFKLANEGYTLRSGGADGADNAFEFGAKKSANNSMEIYLPWKGFNGRPYDEYLDNMDQALVEIAEEKLYSVEPKAKERKDAVRKLFTRNVFQCLGQHLKQPSKKVVCWTPEGRAVGGTRIAINLAEKEGIPVENLYFSERARVFMDYCGLENLVYNGFIEHLNPNEVFVFGSNLDGFHGGGSAGFASFGKAGNNWRAESYNDNPDGWKGKWNVKGVGEGLQQGKSGMSYALPTVVHAGAPKSITPKDLKANIKRFYDCCDQHKDKWFFVAYGVENRNLNGYSSQELATLFNDADKGVIPKNVVFNADFYKLVKQK